MEMNAICAVWFKIVKSSQRVIYFNTCITNICHHDICCSTDMGHLDICFSTDIGHNDSCCSTDIGQNDICCSTDICHHDLVNGLNRPIAWWRQKPKQTRRAFHCGIYRGSAILTLNVNFPDLSGHVLAAEWNAEKVLGSFILKWQPASQFFIISASVRIDLNSERRK